MSETIRPSGYRALQRTEPRPGQITEAKRQRFLDTLAETCNVRVSAEASGMDRNSFYRRRDAGFADAWQAAMAIGYLRLEEALLHYALSRIEADAIDPDRADPDAVAASAVGRLSERRVPVEELRFIAALLERHRTMAEGRARTPRGTRRATAAETDAALRKHLDTLARQTTKHGA